MRVKKSSKFYGYGGKAAVITRFNQFVGDHAGEDLDWGELIAELIEAYEEGTAEAVSKSPVRATLDWGKFGNNPA